MFEGNLIEGNLEESPDLIRDAWFYANKNPTRDRLGPESLLDIIQEVWDSKDILIEKDNMSVKDS